MTRSDDMLSDLTQLHADGSRLAHTYADAHAYATAVRVTPDDARALVPCLTRHGYHDAARAITNVARAF